MSTVTGWDVDAVELRATAQRIVLAKRVFNQREGATAADDTLPPRMLETPLPLGSGRVAALSAERLRAMVAYYYAERGLDPQGRPSAAAEATLLLEPEGPRSDYVLFGRQ